MNREIKFRGLKEYSKTEWVIGAYLENIRYINPYVIYNLTGGGFVTVNPDTVGQYIGLKDITGTDIYEGDILRTVRGDWGVVVAKDHCFELTVSKDQSSLYTKDFFEECKIIGNIHQNPELI